MHPSQQTMENKMSLTRHAQKRLQQRGIPESLVDVLIDFGHTSKTSKGCEIVFLTQRDKRQIAGSLAKQNLCSRVGNAYLVLDPSGNVVVDADRKLTHIERMC